MTREELIALMREMANQTALCHISPRLAGEIVEALEGSEPVVRCENCKYYSEDGLFSQWCDWNESAAFGPNDFCSGGKPKETVE